MSRQEEIKELLKHLLKKTTEDIDKCYFGEEFNKIKRASKDTIANAKQIEIYINELNEITKPS